MEVCPYGFQFRTTPLLHLHTEEPFHPRSANRLRSCNRTHQCSFELKSMQCTCMLDHGFGKRRALASVLPLETPNPYGCSGQ
jgi:hypothetical protein